MTDGVDTNVADQTQADIPMQPGSPGHEMQGAEPTPDVASSVVSNAGILDEIHQKINHIEDHVSSIGGGIAAEFHTAFGRLVAELRALFHRL